MTHPVETEGHNHQGWSGSRDFWMFGGLIWLSSAIERTFVEHHGWGSTVLSVAAGCTFFVIGYSRKPISSQRERYLFWLVAALVLGTQVMLYGR